MTAVGDSDTFRLKLKLKLNDLTVQVVLALLIWLIISEEK